MKVTLITILLAFFLCIGNSQDVAKLDPKLLIKSEHTLQKVGVILSEKADISAAANITGKDAKANFVYRTLIAKADQSQESLKNWLNAKKIPYRSFYIVNMIAAEMDRSMMIEIASFPEVASIIEDSKYTIIEPVTERPQPQSRSIEWNITKINAPNVWLMGYKGQNVTIGGQDTGYDWTHLALQSKYRGWNGATADHNYNWHDAIHAINPGNTGSNPCGYNSLVPCDDHRHGTHTMGTMVGDDGGDNQIGVAPNAKWIGCRNMERGDGTLTTYVECFEWFLAPYPLGSTPSNGDPTKSPHVINNSWACDAAEGCNTSNFAVMEAALDNLRNSGCVIVASAGNSGFGCNTVNNPPAIFEGSFSVGSTTSVDAISDFSSRGVVTIDGSNRMKPNISAPGSGVRSAILNGGYATFNGTSMAGPHVAGLVALVISANPLLAGEVDLIENIIEASTFKPTGNTQNCNGTIANVFPNNTFGHGRIDAEEAVKLAQLYVPNIKIDQFGYLPNDEKIAVLSNPITGYNNFYTYTPSANIQLRDAITHAVILSAAAAAWNGGATHDQSGDKVWRFNFSSVTTPGSYYIIDGNNSTFKSETFEVKTDVYKNILKSSFRTYYHHRCGVAKSAPSADTGYTDAVCHSQDLACKNVLDKTNASLYKDMSGGWHDAGDYNKYINFAGNVIHDLCMAYELNPEAWTDDTNIPESGNGVPDLLDEIKFELDWFQKMQDTDGGVYCMVGVNLYDSYSPPSTDISPRYYGPKTTSASLTAAFSYALAARQFKKIDNVSAQSYATTLQAKAILAWNWATANPSITFNNSTAGPNVIYAGEQEVDVYTRNMYKLRAAIYLFALTGNAAYKTYVENNYSSAHLLQWTFVYPFEAATQEALLFYAHLSGVNSTVGTAIKNAFRTSIDNSPENLPAHTSDLDPYSAYLKTSDYTWGSNGTKSHQANQYQFYQHYRLDDTKNASLDKIVGKYINYIHGVNPNALCYLTNMSSLGAKNSINTIYHTWFADGSATYDDVRTSTRGPLPSILSGGPNPSWALDECCATNNCSGQNSDCINQIPPSNQPTQKSYKDWNNNWPQNSWSITENSTGYQSAYLLMLSHKVNNSNTQVINSNTLKISNSDIVFTPSSQSVILTAPNGQYHRLSIGNNGIITQQVVSTLAANTTQLLNASVNITTANSGMILTSPDANIWKVNVDNGGALVTARVTSIPTINIANQNRDLVISNINHGLILKDNRNICYLLKINNIGNLITSPTECLE